MRFSRGQRNVDFDRFIGETTAGKKQVRATDWRRAFVSHCFTFAESEIRIRVHMLGFYKSYKRYVFLRDRSKRNERNRARIVRQRIRAIAKIFAI